MTLSVLVAVHNERENIAPFYSRVLPVLRALPDLDAWQIVFINDGSTDDSLEEILKLRAQDKRVKVVSLSRNFGYQPALLAGLTLVESERYAILDVDGEDPPELLTPFHQALGEGTQVAYGIRSNREEPWPLTWLRALFYHVNQRIADSPTLLWMAEFSMFTRQVRDAVLAPRTTFPFLRSEIAYVGFRRAGIDYRRSKRLHGRSHYNLWRMTRFAVAGFLAGSTFPLRLVLYVSAFLALAFPAFVWTGRLSLDAASKMASLLALYLLLGTLPILSLYLARTYRNVVARPVFILDRERTELG